jgi:hypothetical protein
MFILGGFDFQWRFLPNLPKSAGTCKFIPDVRNLLPCPNSKHEHRDM